MTSAEKVEGLRYLDAAHVEHPAGMLAGIRVCSATGEVLGSVEGVLLEPARRRIHYFVLERAALLARRRYLLPVDDLVLNAEDRTIDVEANAPELERFDARSVAAFSDDDVIAAMFAPNAA